jgi:hypothetical protein
MVTVTQIATLLGLVAADVGHRDRAARRRAAGRNLRAVPLEPRLVRRIGVIALREREPTPAAAGFPGVACGASGRASIDASIAIILSIKLLLA